MKRMKGLLLAAIGMLAANCAVAQTYTETAGLFSRTKPTGSARILGMGGANVSLGGDMSSAYSNPAGLGMFNHSEFTISPGFQNFKNTNGDYYSNTTQLSSNNGDSRTALTIPAFGLVFSKPKREEGFLQGTFAITMTRINDFNSNQRYEGGPNPNTSIIDYFIDQSNGYPPSQFDQGGDLYNTVSWMGWQNYLFESGLNNDPNSYYTDITGQPYQSETIQTKGGQNQWNFSYGANFNDKFFLGGGIGIVGLNYQSAKVYSETFSDGPLSSIVLQENLQIKGTGINLTVGGIVRPITGLQLGATITTPTRYNLTDSYSASMDTQWNNYDYYGDGSQYLNHVYQDSDGVLTSSYNLTTPWKFAFGASYIFGKLGLLSLDIEHLNYAGTRYASQTTGVSFSYDNDQIKQNYTSRTNIRLGGEVRVKNFRFRGGVGIMPDIASQSVVDSRPTTISNTWTTGSLGVGYRMSKFYIDIAYVQTAANGRFKFNGNSLSINNASDAKGNVYVPYSVNSGPGLVYNTVSQNFIATVGVTF